MILVCSYYLYRNKIAFTKNLSKVLSYLIFSGFFLFTQLFSAFSEGGNSGNFQVGFVPLIPYFILGLQNIPLSRFFILFLPSLLILPLYIIVNGNLYQDYKNRFSIEQSLTKTLNSINPSRILSTDDSYLIVRNLTARKVISYNSWIHYASKSPYLKKQQFLKLLRVQKPDVIVCVNKCSNEIADFDVAIFGLQYQTLDSGVGMDRIFVKAAFKEGTLFKKWNITSANSTIAP
jgi:hypothetical protein